MNPNVKMRHLRNPPVIEVTSPLFGDPLYFTRIYMGIVGPTHEPGYGVIVGEEWDGDPRQKTRPKVILDEVTALRPADLLDRYPDLEPWHDLLYVKSRGADGEETLRDRSDIPTLDDLRPALVALKDIWHPPGIYIKEHPDDEEEWERLPLPAVTSPGDENFVQYLRATDGLEIYDKGDEVPIDEDQHKLWHPFFSGLDTVCSINAEPPFGEDTEYSDALVKSLVAGKELRAMGYITRFLDKSQQHPTRAVGLVCGMMQYDDWTYEVRKYRPSDGYEELPSPEVEAEVVEKEMFEVEAALRRAGHFVGRR